MNALLLALGLAVQAPPTDWPEFQGPHRTGKIDVVDADFDWPEHGPGVVWAVPTGRGFGGAAIRDGEVFLFDREVGSQDILRVFDLTSGEEKWRVAYDAPGRLQYAGSRTVPSVQEGHVYTCGPFGQVTCFDRESHAIVWSVDLEEVYGGAMPGYGWTCSPLVIGDRVVVAALGEDVGLVAFERFTGEEAWVTEPVGRSHSAPVLMELLGKPQIVFLSTTGMAMGGNTASPNTISSFDPEWGDLLWQTETMLSLLPIPGPVRVDDERFFVTGGYRAGSTLMRIQKTEDGFAFEELFHIERGAQVQLPILHDDHLYLLVNENWNHTRARRKEGGLLCLSLDGDEVWRTADDPFFGRGNAVLVGDKLLIQDGTNGILRVARATPEGYQQIAEANIFGIDDRADHQMWAPMAISGRYLLLRSQEELLCVEL